MKFNRRYFNSVKEFSRIKFKLKNQQAVLGFFWNFLNPLILTSILFFLFKNRMGQNYSKDYFLYVLVGTIGWNFFATVTSMCVNSIYRKAELVKNFVFPKEILVYSDIILFSTQHLFEFLIIFLFVAIFGIGFSKCLFFLPIIIAIEILLISGISLFLSCIRILYANDLDNIWNIATRILFFLVPVFYNISAIAAPLKWIVAINPISQIIIFLRQIILYHQLPPNLNLILVSIFSISFFITGYKFFKSCEYKIVENI